MEALLFKCIILLVLCQASYTAHFIPTHQRSTEQFPTKQLPCTYPKGSLACKLWNHTNLDCTYRGLECIPPLQQATSLTEFLDLSGNNISQVLTCAFCDFNKLQKLHLTDNHISFLQEKAFSGLHELQHLDLRKNLLSTLTVEVFSECGKLESLDLSNNFISTLPDGIFMGMYQLQTVDLSHNKLSKITKDVLKGLLNLRHLSLNDNELGIILTGSPFQNLASLQTLKLGDSDLPVSLANATFCGLTNLLELELYVHVNSTTELSFTGLASLRHLLLNINVDSVSDCTKIEKSFTGLDNLEYFAMRHMHESQTCYNYDFCSLTSLNFLRQTGGNLNGINKCLKKVPLEGLDFYPLPAPIYPPFAMLTHLTNLSMFIADNPTRFMQTLQSLDVSVSKTIGLETAGSPEDVLCRDNISMLYAALLAALKDYSTDQRGDVGAWVREASMESLCDVTLLVVQKDPSLLTPDTCESIIQNLLQQASEKIDRTRSCAGDVFLKLLHNDPPVPNIPEREQLLNIFPKSDIVDLNWSAPSECFRKITQLLSLPVYRYHVLLGVTVSVGGLTESLVKHSSQSLLTYLREHCSIEEQLDIFTSAVVKVFTDFQKEDRVSVPMMKMIDMLLSSGSLESYVENTEHSFPTTILGLVKKEIVKCGEPQKLLTSIDVFCGLIQFPGITRKKSLSQLLMFLCHKYPKVRKMTANKLYETLLVYDEVMEEEKQEDVLGLLSETKWDEPLEIVRPLRNQLCDMMGMPKPVMKVKDNKASGAMSATTVPTA